jgi:hypothetical protein
MQCSTNNSFVTVLATGPNWIVCLYGIRAKWQNPIVACHTKHVSSSSLRSLRTRGLWSFLY